MKNKPELAEDCVETKTQGNSEAEVEGDEENYDEAEDELYYDHMAEYRNNAVRHLNNQ
jgi:hypothetical protein